MQIPFLTEDETEEILQSYGASTANCEEFKSIVHILSHGHPTISSAICKFLRAANWSVDSEQLTRLFKNDYSIDLTEETYSDVVNTIENSETRELLYRLNIIRKSFTYEQVALVAQIDPPISAPLEKFSSIVGLWVQRGSNDRYDLSPLIERLKDDNLNALVVKKINLNLGLQILSKKRFNQFEALQAIRYFLAGGASNQAGFVLIVALNDALKTPEIFFDWGFSLYWTKEELPKEMDISTKIYIRILHLMLFIKRENKYSDRITFIRNDLEKILVSADPSAQNYSYAALFLSGLYSKDDSSKSLKYFTLGVQFFENSDPDGLIQELENKYSPEQLLWASTRAITTEQQVEEWFRTFKSLSAQRRAKAIELSEVRMGATFITENLINSEEKKDQLDQDWNNLLNIFERIKANSQELSIKLMVARAIKGIIYITSSKLDNIGKAKQIGDEALQRFQGEDRSCRFLINDTLGRELFYKGKQSDAEKYLAEAIAMDVDDFYTDKLDTYIVMSQVLGDKDKISAHHYIEKALAFVEDEFVFTNTQRVKVRAEYAISLSLMGRIDKAIIHMEKGYDTIFTSGNDLTDYQILMLRYQHVINYWHSVHHKKKLPNEIDGEPYQAPHRGYFFIRYTNDYVEKNWFDERPFIGAHLLLSCFEYLGNIPMAKKWAISSIAVNKAMQSNAFSLIGHIAVPYFIIDDKYDEAIECEVSLLNQYNAIGEARKNITNERFKKMLTNAPWPTKSILEFDEYIIVTVIVPTVMRLLTLRIERNPDFLKHLQNAIAAAERWKTIFTHQDAVKKIIDLLTELENERIDGSALATNLKSYSGNFAEHIKGVGYLIASLFTASSESFYLHEALIKTTEETMKKVGVGSYKFILLPFLEAFWFNRIKDRPSDISENIFWTENSLPFYRRASEDRKVKMMFKILAHHIKGITVSSQLENWIDE